MKKQFAFITLLVLVVVGFYTLFNKPGLNSEKLTNSTVSAYSVDGQVVSISADTLVAKVGRVEDKPEGSAFVTYEKSMLLASTLRFVDGTKNIEISASKLASYLKQKDKAIFYGLGKESPWTGGAFTVNKIELVSSGTPVPVPPVVR